MATPNTQHRRHRRPEKLVGLVHLLPLYSILKNRAGQALSRLRAHPTGWGPVALANALDITPAQVRTLQNWAMLPRPLERAVTLRWLEGLAVLGRNVK